MVDDPGWINVSAGAPSYAANELRRLFAVLMSQAGTVDRFGARSGVHPGGVDAVSLSGITITVAHTKGVVYPGLTATAGPYLVALQTEAHTLTAPDASLPRKDIVILRVEDNDEDSSGFRRARSEYVVGTPNASPVEPTPSGSANWFRMATIDVPASGGGSATLTYNAPWFVAVGGILPVRTTADLPTAGVYKGMWADVRDINALVRWDGAAWVEVARQALTTTSGLTASSGFGVIAFKAWRTGPMVTGLVEVQRTGATIALSGGNLPDTACATLPSGWRPIQTWYGPWGDGFGAGECSITTAGLITVRATSYTGGLENLANVRIPLHFPVVA